MPGPGPGPPEQKNGPFGPDNWRGGVHRRSPWPIGSLSLSEPLCSLGNMVGRRANPLDCRLTQSWAEIRARSAANKGVVKSDARLLAAVFSALGETGNTAGLVDL